MGSSADVSGWPLGASGAVPDVEASLSRLRWEGMLVGYETRLVSRYKSSEKEREIVALVRCSSSWKEKVLKSP